MKQTPLSLFADNLISENTTLEGQGKSPKKTTLVPAHEYDTREGKKQNEAFELSVEDAKFLLDFRSKLTVAAKNELEEKSYDVQVKLAKSFSEYWNL